MLSNGESFLQYGKKAKIINGVSFLFLADILACPEINKTTNIKQFTGEFASVTLNRTGRQTNLSRDVFGAKSLFYYFKNGLLIASTEIRFILMVLESKPIIDTTKIADYLTLDSDNQLIDERTFFADIKRVLPGETCMVLTNGIKKQYHYQPADYPLEHYPNPINFFTNAFENSTKNRISANKKVGANLSGGLDSSTVVSVFRKLSSHKIDTFYFDSGLESSSEKVYANEVAEDKLTNHHVVKRSKNSLAELSEVLNFTASPDPLSIPAVIFLPIYRKAKELGNEIVLSGHGGDNILENGLDYLDELDSQEDVENALYAYLEFQKTKPNEIEEKITRYFLNKKGKSFQEIIPSVLKGEMNFFVLLELFFKQLKSNKAKGFSLSKNEAAKSTISLGDMYPSVKHMKMKRLLTNNLSKLSIQAMETINAISRAYETETSYPFLTKEILETVSKIPSELNFYEGRTRGILKKAMKGTVPSNILNRTDKTNFTDFYVDFVIKLVPKVSHILRAEHKVWEFANDQAYRQAENIIFDTSISNHKKLNEAKTCYRVISLGLWLDVFASR